jgi:pyruvate kinase
VDLVLKHPSNFSSPLHIHDVGACSRYQESARNLLHYVAFRSLDIAGLQETLTSLGLSSLESCEACTLASVNSVISSLRSLLYSAQVDSSRCIGELPTTGLGMSLPSPALRKDLGLPLASSLPPASNTEWTSKLSSEMLQCATQEISRQIGQGNLSSNSQELLGPLSSERGTHIMVTLPSESALEEDTLIQTLLKAGMNVARVNCAHDGPETWSKMIHKVRYFSQLLETPCRVMMDLAGPKLRTGPMRPGPSVLKLKPFKDDAGEVTSPAHVWLASQEDVMKPAASENRVADASIPIMEDISRWHKKIAVGDIFKFKDRKGRSRELLVVAKAATGAWAECKNSAYIESGTEFTIIGGKGAKKCRVTVGELPQVEQAIVLRAGDKLMLTRESILGSPAVLDKAGNIIAPARVSCTLEQVFDAAKIGDPIKFDEGKITGVISAVSSSEICVEITDAGDHKGRKLRGEKAINLPKTDLAVCGLTAKDTGDLDFVATNGDIVALSFVNGPSDVHCLQTELRNRGAPENLGIVLKIETELGFQRLPAVLLQAMETRNSVGVMVARGDMAVECGWQRLAEMQDQILVTCEASHVPTIWATQVLEGMAKSGIPSRAEITDAASGSRYCSCTHLTPELKQIDLALFCFNFKSSGQVCIISC